LSDLLYIWIAYNGNQAVFVRSYTHTKRVKN